MRLRKIMNITQAQLYSPGPDLNGDVQFGCAADLMSDVLYYGEVTRTDIAVHLIRIVTR